jgi:hypothetical protein
VIRYQKNWFKLVKHYCLRSTDPLIIFGIRKNCLDEIIGDHQCGFQRNRLTSDQIFCICQILEKKWEYNETINQIFIDFKKAYDSVRREVLYSILIGCGVPMKVVSLNKVFKWNSE